jgi:hypothetical protein
MQMPERLTDQRLAEIEAAHVRRGIRCAGICYGEAYWPCDAVELLAEVRRLRANLEALADTLGTSVSRQWQATPDV